MTNQNAIDSISSGYEPDEITSETVVTERQEEARLAKVLFECLRDYRRPEADYGPVLSGEPEEEGELTLIDGLIDLREIARRIVERLNERVADECKLV